MDYFPWLARQLGRPPAALKCRPLASLNALRRYGDLAGLHLPIHTGNPVAQRLFTLVRAHSPWPSVASAAARDLQILVRQGQPVRMCPAQQHSGTAAQGLQPGQQQDQRHWAGQATRRCCVQGMLQRWDFNDIEALRSFDNAITVANESAMLHFGRAYVLGPGTNR